MSRTPLLGTVLAGGRSTRMGRCKADLPHASGGSFLDHAIAQLSACCDHVACSLAADPAAAPLPNGVHTIVDAAADRGPAQGVCQAVGLAKSLRCTGVLITPVDLPALTSEHLQRLIIAAERSHDQVIAAISDDAAATKRLQPLVAIYPVSLQGELNSLAHSTHRSLYRFLSGVDCLTVELPTAVLHNVNSPHDLLP
ncbi:molybdenum cofactor guanylyltransferase [Allorhodopirellula solitaria]|uniref:Molybdopterin-guanine dinucleotide biosynthesis protein MobA n=1 Tax=Allorhodopirellula solitaria TaxID=2527987 RepID=A0A5C5XWC3_9BACT|nr:molybdenum cofactor guanylyltransferase [Allorhodopirellula solitaria]TWT67220.1 molybdopterin-guanine dinucleotide biosynthesis protein MobA [Allorhodopirellula solitaria]